ncbi:MAG: signal peptidase II [Varibaculum sp.]|nr:signal peptidase II [Varibaculum sp.]
MRGKVTGAAVFVVVVFLDQLTKFLAMSYLQPGHVKPLIGDFVSLQLISNPGAAFSLGIGAAPLFTVIALVVLVVIALYIRRVTSLWWIVALMLLAAGAFGNLIDRLVQSPGWGRGHVVDFINYKGFFVGNVADIAIVIAVVIILSLTFMGSDPQVKVTESHGGDADAA